MSNLAYIEHYSVDEWKLWEGDWELIYGVPYAMAPSPIYGHQFVMGKIYRQLDEGLDECEKCQALVEIDYFISKDTVTRPDVLVICYEPKEKITKAPKIIFEVVSKSSKKRDEIIKKELYFDEKVEYYCLVYPDKKESIIYKLDNDEYRYEGRFAQNSFEFEVEGCKIDFDFKKIWKNK